MTDAQPSLLDVIEASKARDLVLDRFEETRRPWIDTARAKAREIYARNNGLPVSVVMVRAECPPPENVDPRCMGAIFRKPEWKKVGYAESCRVECHNRPVALFVLARES